MKGGRSVNVAGTRRLRIPLNSQLRGITVVWCKGVCKVEYGSVFVHVCVLAEGNTVTLKPKSAQPTPTVERMMCYSVNDTIDQTDACLR